MPGVKLFLLTAFSCWIALCFAQCGTNKRKSDEPPATTTALKPEDDSKITFEAYKKANSPATKIGFVNWPARSRRAED
jgi:hypothetical protein